MKTKPYNQKRLDTEDAYGTQYAHAAKGQITRVSERPVDTKRRLRAEKKKG